MAESSLGERLWYKHWPEQVPKCLDYPDCTLADFLKESAAKNGSKEAINFLETSMTYDQLWDLVRRLATALDRLGLKKGDVCALMLPNSFQFEVSYYACQLLGVTVTAMNPTYKALEIEYQLKDSGAKALIVLDALYGEAGKGIRGTGVTTVIGTNVVDLCGFSPLKVFLGKLLKKIPTGPLPPETFKAQGPPQDGAGPARGQGRSGRGGRLAVHRRNHRSPQGSHADPPQRGLQRGHVRRLALEKGRPGRHRRPPAPLPLLCHDHGHEHRHPDRRGSSSSSLSLPRIWPIFSRPSRPTPRRAA